MYEWYAKGIIFNLAHPCTTVKLNEKSEKKFQIWYFQTKKAFFFFKTFHLTFELLWNVIENVLPRWELENVLKFWKFHIEQTFFQIELL
jgi:hypothetical protein